MTRNETVCGVISTLERAFACVSPALFHRPRWPWFGSVLQVAEKLIIAIWLVGLVFWIVASFGVKRTKFAAPRAQQALHHLMSLGAFVLMVWPVSHVGFLGHQLLPRTDAIAVIGVAVLAAGMAFTLWARVCLGRNWSAMVTIKEDHRLIRVGPYALTRHPIYTGLIASMAGTGLALGETRHVLAAGLFAVAYWRKSRIEERWLLQEFGAEYQRYQKEVPALIPFHW
jgi:protein-S-isoprenylcysteine O-methyltransferase Ste14